MRDSSRPVYSSEHGPLCPDCGQATTACRCRSARKSAIIGNGIVRVRREKKGRGGKTVTLITGIPLTEEALKILAGDLKRRCGTGGTVKAGTVEIQGDHLDMLISELQQRGFAAKQGGG